MYKNNQVSTAKYNLITFFPKNIFYQFSKMANFYFLMMMILELIPETSDSEGKPVILFPLSFVVGLSMIKDLYEDVKRHLSDRSENNN